MPYTSWTLSPKDYEDYVKKHNEMFCPTPMRKACWSISPDEYSEYLNQENSRFVCSPVSNACFSTDGITWREKDLDIPHELDILTKALLGILNPVGYKLAQYNAILNDSWMVNLRQQPLKGRENIMFEEMLKQLKKSQETPVAIQGVNLTDEIKDLLNVYTESEKHLIDQEQRELLSLSAYMKRFLKVQDERKAMSEKLKNLKEKLTKGKAEESSDESCDCQGDE